MYQLWSSCGGRGGEGLRSHLWGALLDMFFLAWVGIRSNMSPLCFSLFNEAKQFCFRLFLFFVTVFKLAKTTTFFSGVLKWIEIVPVEVHMDLYLQVRTRRHKFACTLHVHVHIVTYTLYTYNRIMSMTYKFMTQIYMWRHTYLYTYLYNIYIHCTSFNRIYLHKHIYIYINVHIRQTIRLYKIYKFLC